MEELRRKARLIAGGHVMDPPATIMNMLVVSRETVRFDLTLATLNNWPVKVADIKKA